MISLVLPKNTYLILVALAFTLLFTLCSCGEKEVHKQADSAMNEGVDNGENKFLIAADQTEAYLPRLKKKKIAIVANQTSVIQRNDSGGSAASSVHLVDSLLSHDIEIIRVFSPEHGFRGRADAGEAVEDGRDQKTGIELVSLYGKNKKPKPEHLEGVDLVLFDIQDVGVRFYTYISTLSYVMEACAELGIPVMVLDRPNPNAHYVDGPMLDPTFKSFVGMHPVPLVYGMTIGEYGMMVNGEKWLKDGIQCNLTVIELKNYNHDLPYSLQIRPSPNLPNDQSINLYPSLGFFEGTIINAGRGTEFQFQRYGAPFFPESEFFYTPQPNFGSKTPKFKGEKCFGVDLSQIERLNKVRIDWVLDAYQKTPENKEFFGKTFTSHAGSEKLQKKMEDGMSAEEIWQSWQADIASFKTIRQKYLIYP